MQFPYFYPLSTYFGGGGVWGKRSGSYKGRKEEKLFKIKIPQLQIHISIAVVDLIQEMTDVDTLNENDEAATAFTDVMVRIKLKSTKQDKTR